MSDAEPVPAGTTALPGESFDHRPEHAETGASPGAVAISTDAVEFDDAIVRQLMMATIFWGIIGMLVGVIVALQLANPLFNFETSWLSFGRLRPLHTNAVIFAFAGNAIFTAVYYSTQRLLKVLMFSDLLSRVHFWGWQGIIAAAAITLPLGLTQSKEYA